jgi:hypothetical protein
MSQSTVRRAAVLLWIDTYGTFLTRLELSGFPDPSEIRQLPCPNLQHLLLGHCGVQLDHGSKGAGILHSCTALKNLILRFCTLLDSCKEGTAAEVPTAAIQLQHLTLSLAHMPGNAHVAALAAGVAPHLTALTSLTLRNASAFLGLGRHVSTMVSLQELGSQSSGGCTDRL